jgi:hypothetical protein
VDLNQRYHHAHGAGQTEHQENGPSRHIRTLVASKVGPPAPSDIGLMTLRD